MSCMEVTSGEAITVSIGNGGREAPSAGCREAIFPATKTHPNLGVVSSFFPQVHLGFFPHILNPMYYIHSFPSQCPPFKSKCPVRLIVQLALQFSQSQDGVQSDVLQISAWRLRT